MEVWQEATWRARAEAHGARVDDLVADHLARRGSGQRHPVHDFLFTYYAQKPGRLRRWHPGAGVLLAGDATTYDGLKGYVRTPDGTGVDPAYVVGQRPLITSLHALLAATAARPATLGCFGLHEWAMVYRLGEDETRHPDHPLRLGPAGTDEVVEKHRVSCSHFDAYRFFTPPARSLNLLSPAADDRPGFEQPGCLHAGMDLYKTAYRLTPMVPSELVADCFEHARAIRVIDMRASPYDLTDLGFEPIPIETPAGKAEYIEHQRHFVERGAPLRQALIEHCAHLLRVPVA